MSGALVEVVRSSLVEGIHRGDVAVVEADGRLRAWVGDPRAKVTYWRSAAKPFQAMPLVSHGGVERWNLGPEHVAIVAASHNGEAVHVRRVDDLLRLIEAAPGDLTCGTHPPLRAETAAALEREGARATPLHHNCSGKHAGMLGLATLLGAERVGYERPDHPVQQEILRNVARFAGLAASDVRVGVDGCGVPTFATSVYSLALAFARLAEPTGIDEPYAGAARTVSHAMRTCPHLVAGTGRFDTALMELGARRFVAKGGAAGAEGVAVAGGIGIAVKIEDGATGPTPGRPTSVATVETLRQLDLLCDDEAERLGEHARPLLRNPRGDVVGEGRAVFELATTPGTSAT